MRVCLYSLPFAKACEPYYIYLLKKSKNTDEICIYFLIHVEIGVEYGKIVLVTKSIYTRGTSI